MAAVKREEKARNIQVVVRCRPFNTVERKSSYGIVDCDQRRKEVAVRTTGGSDKARKTYTFDMVFGPAAKQIEVYRSVLCPILDEVILGYNCTVFAYGQTGTGKTFTMEGERTQDEHFTWEEDPLAGIIPRTLHQIFEKLSDSGTEFSVKVSLLEIYNEELFDLLSPTEDASERLQLFDDPRNKRGVVVRGLEEVVVHNKDEVYQILERGAAKRRTAYTLMNAYSSRSHSVFSVTIHMKEITVEGEELVKIGKLNLVDLAGSESIGRSGSVDKRAREAGSINQSLLTLGRVITALVEKRPHIPYRESKLTRILQDSLGGRTKTSIIATVSPSSSNLEETLSTLDYASRAKNIMNKPEVNQKLTKRTLIKEYTEEIERLKRDLAASRDKNGVYLSAENYQSLVGQNTCYEEQIAIMEDELKKVTELFADSKSRLKQCTLDLDHKQQRLEETSRDLQQTRDQLHQELFISSELALAQEGLYHTAGQLLSVVEDSTGDVSGLHAKLDRKTKVELYNRHQQQSFSTSMDVAFSDMQRCLQEHGDQQRQMLKTYSHAIDGLLQLNENTLREALTSMETLVSGVKPLLTASVSRCRDSLHQQEELCVTQREGLLQLLAEHGDDMKEELQTRALVGVCAVKDLGAALNVCVDARHALADQVEAMMESAEAVGGLAEELLVLRQSVVHDVSALQRRCEQLEDDITHTQEQQKESLRGVMEQFSLLSVKNNQDFLELRSSAKSLQEPLNELQDDISRRCSAMESHASSQVAFLSSSSLSVSSALRQRSEESRQLLQQLSERTEHVHNSVSGLAERSLQWNRSATTHTQNWAELQLSMIAGVKEAETLQQEVELLCSHQVCASEQRVCERGDATRVTLNDLQEETTAQLHATDHKGAELQQLIDAGRKHVTRFLQEELQHDVPTGATPQRKDFVYPRHLEKTRSRNELLKELRNLQEDMVEEEEEDKMSSVDPDSVEEELSTCNLSTSTEPSFIDENLVFNESHRLPFFKKKSKTAKVKLMENESSPSQKSRLPLRCQNGSF
ncbi:kinesin-like protein KIF11 isoform X2 [Gouania willdenowi]|uniref:Kinesin motor domain-containing protein n=2 Tax=Gouania willdenowi TaxID=441366 RepID=A0A8C5H0H3_GOUWI|nr:kinesin-like protein KIF11 isoform X2 [Gouania willdenowi]